MNRLVELMEGPDGKLSSTKLCTYIAVLVLSIVLIISTFNRDEPSSEIAFILASLALGTLITNRTADVKMSQGPSPIVTANVSGDINVQPQQKNTTEVVGNDAA